MGIFFPGEYLDSTYVIDFDKLYQDGYRSVILMWIIPWFHMASLLMKEQRHCLLI